MTWSKVEENKGESRLSQILRKFDMYPIFPDFSLNIGENRDILELLLLLEENLKGFDPKSQEKSRKILISPNFQS